MKTEMKFEYGIIIVVGALVSISLVSIYNQPDSIPYLKYFQEIKQRHDIGCDEDCKLKQEAKGAICTEITKDEYICRPAREIFYQNKEMQIRAVLPLGYGEFLYYPDGLRTKDSRLYDIIQVDLVNPETKQIRVEFVDHKKNASKVQPGYFADLIPGQTFVSHCLGGDSKTTHTVEYLDVFEMEGRTYIEFWGSHVIMPDELLPCQIPAIIEHSLTQDLSLGITFDMD